jgi:hypothetical protein
VAKQQTRWAWVPLDDLLRATVHAGANPVCRTILFQILPYF